MVNVDKYKHNLASLQIVGMLSNQETMDNIIAATPGLEADPIAVGQCFHSLYSGVKKS